MVLVGILWREDGYGNQTRAKLVFSGMRRLVSISKRTAGKTLLGVLGAYTRTSRC